MKLPCMHLLLAVGAQATPCSPRAVERRDRACARARAWLRDKQLACPEFFALPAGADPCAACPEPLSQRVRRAAWARPAYPLR